MLYCRYFSRASVQLSFFLSWSTSSGLSYKTAYYTNIPSKLNKISLGFSLDCFGVVVVVAAVVLLLLLKLIETAIYVCPFVVVVLYEQR